MASTSTEVKEWLSFSFHSTSYGFSHIIDDNRVNDPRMKLRVIALKAAGQLVNMSNRMPRHSQTAPFDSQPVTPRERHINIATGSRAVPAYELKSPSSTLPRSRRTTLDSSNLETVDSPSSQTSLLPPHTAARGRSRGTSSRSTSPRKRIRSDNYISQIGESMASMADIQAQPRIALERFKAFAQTQTMSMMTTIWCTRFLSDPQDANTFAHLKESMYSAFLQLLFAEHPSAPVYDSMPLRVPLQSTAQPRGKIEEGTERTQNERDHATQMLEEGSESDGEQAQDRPRR